MKIFFFLLGSEEPTENYMELLNDVAKKWIELELRHCTSKKASDDFWTVAKEAFPRLHRAKVNCMVSKNTPKLPGLRRRMYKERVPKIKIEIGYLNKDTKEIEVAEGDTTPRMNPQLYQKLYEVATVEVIMSYINPSLYLSTYLYIYMFYVSVPFEFSVISN